MAFRPLAQSPRAWLVLLTTFCSVGCATAPRLSLPFAGLSQRQVEQDRDDEGAAVPPTVELAAQRKGYRPPPHMPPALAATAASGAPC